MDEAEKKMREELGTIQARDGDDMASKLAAGIGLEILPALKDFWQKHMAQATTEEDATRRFLDLLEGLIVLNTGFIASITHVYTADPTDEEIDNILGLVCQLFTKNLHDAFEFEKETHETKEDTDDGQK